MVSVALAARHPVLLAHRPRIPPLPCNNHRRRLPGPLQPLRRDALRPRRHPESDGHHRRNAQGLLRSHLRQHAGPSLREPRHRHYDSNICHLRRRRWPRRRHSNRLYSGHPDHHFLLPAPAPRLKRGRGAAWDKTGHPGPSDALPRRPG